MTILPPQPSPISPSPIISSVSGPGPKELSQQLSYRTKASYRAQHWMPVCKEKQVWNAEGQKLVWLKHIAHIEKKSDGFPRFNINLKHLDGIIDSLCDAGKRLSEISIFESLKFKPYFKV